MKCLVLGASGFIGKNLVDKLIFHGHDVRTYSRNDSSKASMAEGVSGDFTKSENLRDALHDIDVVYHLISTSLPNLPFNMSIEDINDNLIPTITLLNLMVEAGNKKIIFASSGGTVYGNSMEPVLNESQPTNPICSYGITKLTIEKFITLFTLNSSISAVILRISNPYGENHRIDSNQGLINKLCHNVSNGLQIEIWGDGNVIRDYLHVDDVTNAMVESLKETGKNLTVNISSGSGLSVNEITRKILALADSNVDILYKPGRKFDVKHCVLSNNLAEDQLGWKPLIDIDTGIERTFKWHLQSLRK